MVHAMWDAVAEGMSANQAAATYGVPPSTLKDRVSGRVNHGDKPGPRTYLTVEEEKELADYLLNAAKAGYGKTWRQVQLIVEKIANEKGRLKSFRIFNRWRERFLQRNPLSECSPPSLTQSPSGEPLSVSQHVPTQNSSDSQQTQQLSTSDFTDEQIAWFERRVEEGYNVYDPDYAAWLVQTHPDKVPSHFHSLQSTVSSSSLTLCLSGQPSSVCSPSSLGERLSVCSPPSPTQSEEREQKKQEAAEKREKHKKEQAEKKQKKEEEARRKKEEAAKKKLEKSQSRACVTCGKKSSAGASKHDDQLSSPTHPSDQQVMRKDPIGPIAESSSRKDSLSKTSVSMRDDDSPSSSHISESSPWSGRKRPNPADAGSRSKRARYEENCEVDTDQCCVCFCLFDQDVSGSEWLECACGRWLYEDCMEECIIDSKGKRICPIYISFIS